MASDTFAEVVEWLERKADGAKACGLQDNHMKYLKAARLLAAAGEYAKQTHRLIADSGLPTKTYKAELRAVPQGIDAQDTLNDWCNARAALDQLAPELKEIA